ncbi:MAG: hypothetical protein V2B15_08770 [Bacteroidota bacterium]
MKLPFELRKWITAVIKQRSYLVRQGVSKKNSSLMTENMEYLRRHLDYYPYETDRKISLLFQRNRARILSLLPGDGASGHEKLMEEFNHYDRVTMKILGSPIIQHSDMRRGAQPASQIHGGLSPSFL